jgi:hypothetical protein
MSDGKFTVPIVTDDGRVLAWDRGDYLVHDAAYHKELATDLRFLRYANGEVTEISKEAKDAILAKDVADAQAREAAATAEAAAAADADAAAASANAAAAIGRQLRVQGLRDAYASATAQLCQLAGVPIVRCLTMEQVQSAVMPLLAGEQADMTNGLISLLTNLEGKLCRVDGDDALDRV